jgi:diguanylate cyclase (GGDEF)-like protein/PAS domain S-box-containing protein
MLAIVDAFDSMTTDQVYRPALSRERALHELFEHAGTQFDPDLVQSFSEISIGAHLHQKVIGHWLKTLDPRKANQFWRNTPQAMLAEPAVPADSLFQQKLFDNMFDAVVFVDANMRIIKWNRGAERLTGLPCDSVLHRNWAPELIGLCDEKNGELYGNDCPVTYCISTGVQSLRRLLVRTTNKVIAVDVHTVPVVAPDGATRGAAMLLHDASPQASLEEQCNNLHERATKDPLTQVANRAEFDRMHHLFVGAHLECHVACSLIICDIDHFKSINDNYGHQAGDEVLRSFGRLLRSECRSGDVVARYGGEEFVILCANCNNASATRRAEDLRRIISELEQPVLNGNVVTVSFGVTEIQPGDTPESMLRRADRALLEAKRIGRNTVVQLGDGLNKPGPTDETASLEGTPSGELMIDRVLITSVPLNMAVEKLRGFVLDHHAEILGIKADRIDLQIDAGENQPTRRRSDRPVPLVVELLFAEQQVTIRNAEGQPTARTMKTRVRVSIRLKRTRDRRNAEIMLQASAVLAAIQSYLMAHQETANPEPGTSRRAANMLAPWLKLRS